ncbi:MAG: hypothetical protein GY797_33265 [Deltaproteobacteria bacterium]|nr:hypothetical protein [Deltaproteobacteria bacterium]
MSSEIGADTAVVSHFNNKADDSHLVAKAFQAHRAIKSLSIWNDNEHATNAAVRVGSEGPVSKGSENKFITQLHESRNLIWREIGMETAFWPISYSTAAQNIVLGLPPTDEQEVHIVNLHDEEILIELVANPLAKDFFDKEKNLSQETQDVLYKAVREMDRADGAVRGVFNPALFYEKTHGLYLDNVFNELPIGKQYVYEFLVAAHNYAPDYFETAKFSQEDIVAPVFDEQGQYIAPEVNKEAIVVPSQ